MRKIENEMLYAVRSRKNWHSGNTEVRIVDDGTAINVYLHGNHIYTKRGEDCVFTMAGWNTPTTRSRLHALGVNVWQRNFTPYYNGEEISSYKWYSVK